MSAEQIADGWMQKPYAYCCAEGGGDPASCDCVSKDHGVALFPKATCIITNCRNRAPSDEAFCAKHRNPNYDDHTRADRGWA